MDRYFYERHSGVCFIYDRTFGHSKHIARCDDRRYAEEICAALNAAAAK